MVKRIPQAQGGRRTPVTIACINKSKTDLGVPFDKLTATLQKCYDNEFLPVWGYPIRLYNAVEAKPADWQLLYVDDATRAQTLGYHGLTRNKQPVATVFVKASLANKEPISVTASHELFEMVIDPIANLWAESRSGREYAYEMSDPVEESSFVVDGLQMSNFLHPAWFEPFTHPLGTRYDHLGLLKKPFSLTTGGYMIVKQRGRVFKIFGSNAKAARFAKEDRYGHRSEYRKRDGLRLRS
jgi:hypothetical protein